MRHEEVGSARALAQSQDLVLVGGGHAHVQVLRGWCMRPVPGVRLTVVLDQPVAVYSGMVPGFVAGDYREQELEIDVVPLARRSGARVVLAAATRVDPVARRIELAGRPSIPYDVASLDVGSTVRGLELPGAREHALATRPIGRFVVAVDAWVARHATGAAPRVVVVGAGAGGVELAFALEARLRRAGTVPRVLLVDRGSCLLPGEHARVTRAVAAAAQARGIGVRFGTGVASVEAGAVVLEGGERLGADLVVWATGAAPPSLALASPLPRDARGFVRVGPTLEVEGCHGLFAAGDCAVPTHAPWVPRAGVYAVRAGPRLAANLRARLTGAPLAAWNPQRDFLRLLNLGDGTALGWKWGICFSGAWVWRWKDRIDRRFIRRFQALDPDGAPAEAFGLPPMPGAEALPCGGCAAKVGESALDRALRRLPPGLTAPDVTIGLARREDVAAFALPSGEQVVLTVDAFRAFTEDPWLVGRVAAVNAVSDVLAKGVAPRHALALVSVPDGDPTRAEEALYQALAGARAALDPLGVSLLGGHSTTGPELTVGFAVTGVSPAGTTLLAQDGLRPGQRLVLTKALGTGVLLRADMLGLARGPWVAELHAALVRDNAAAARVARAVGASASTDVTGFGLAGHLGGMLRASGVAAEVWLDTLPALPGARELLRRGLRSTAHAENARARGLALLAGAAEHELLELLFDPQTAGGLLFGVTAERVGEAVDALRRAGEAAAVVGVVTSPRGDGAALSVAPAQGGVPDPAVSS